VFVDDLAFNLTPAAELGMATVHHRTAEQTIAELEKLLAVQLEPV
jgi:FMN phosphatase YigB (HAD superfamily)